jgi:hypothetical protein
VASQTQQLTITLADDNAAGFSTVQPTTHQAILTCEGNAIRWRADGTSPTATVGTRMAAGDTLILMGSDYNDFLKLFKIVNDTAGSNGTISGAGFSGLNMA